VVTAGNANGPNKEEEMLKMQEKNYSEMSASEIYDSFVGNQSPKDFMDYSPNMTVREAVADYRKNCEFFKDLTEEEAGVVESKIESYICDNLGIGPNNKWPI
jgi:hypothetical protein